MPQCRRIESRRGTPVMAALVSSVHLVRGVDLLRVRAGRVAETLVYVKG